MYLPGLGPRPLMLNLRNRLAKDFQLCRIWDSTVFEDEQEEGTTGGFEATGSISSEQTKPFMHLGCCISYLTNGCT